MGYKGSEVPLYLKKAIKIRGGVNKYDEPNYRLVWSEDRYEQTGGLYNEWDESLSVNDRNYFNSKGEKLNTPLRTTIGTRWVRKYPTEHKWILEKWIAPENYGDPTIWYSTGMLGDYPWMGEYEATDYAFPSDALTEGIILNAIGRLMHHMDGLPATTKGRALRMNYIAHQRDDMKEKQLAKRDADIVSDSGYAFSGAPFIGYGDKRKPDIESVADKLGISNTSLK